MISTSLRILQINLNRSLPATESALQTAIELKIDIVLVQEPWIIASTSPSTGAKDFTTSRSVNHQSFVQILPNHGESRPRTLVYFLRSNTLVLASLASSSPEDPDVLVLDLIEGQHKVQLVNIYNEDNQSNQRTIERWLYSYQVLPNTIIAGDFNTHHPWWDPLTTTTSANAEALVDWIEDNHLSLLNTPGEGTFYRSNLRQPSVLDLTLATSKLANQIDDWQTLPDLGSDHFGILFTITGTGIELVDSTSTQNLYFNTEHADWPLFQTELAKICAKDQTNEVSTTSTTSAPESLEIKAQDLTNAILSAAKASIPIRRTGAKPKPWWAPELKEYRQEMMRNQRLVSTTCASSKRYYLRAKNRYFQAIKSAKKNH